MELDIMAKLAAPVITAVVAFIIKKYFEAEPKLISYLVHASAIPLNDENKLKVNTHSIVVRNSGKKTANNIRIGHNHLPKSYQLHPQVTHEVTEGTDESAEILIPTLVPGEQISISYLYFPPVIWNQINSYCKSDEVNAKYINVIPSPAIGKLQSFFVGSLLFIGASTVVYWSFIKIWAWVQ
jgi:hypothetical protein